MVDLGGNNMCKPEVPHTPYAVENRTERRLNEARGFVPGTSMFA